MTSTSSENLPAQPQPSQVSSDKDEHSDEAYGRYLLTGFGLIIALVAGFTAWSFLAPLQGAVVAPGTIVVEGKPKTLQHLDGGIVGEILVRDGDQVKAGDVVMRLDSTSLNANRDLLQNRLNEAKALKARLRAERDGDRRIDWAATFPQEERTPNLDILITDQTKLFTTRQQGFRGEISQLRKRVQQSNDQIAGLTSQASANQRQLDLVQKELSGLRPLLAKGFVSQTRVSTLERDQASLEGQIASLEAEVARTKTIIGETEIQILQVTRTKQEAVLTELRSIESEISDLEEQLITARDQVGRIDVVAPVSGRVHNMTMTTTGGVVTPANPIMDIIPDTERLIVESQVEPASIDQIYLGQKTTVRLSAFNQRTTPELNGNVMAISANTTQDEVTGFPFYTVRIEIPAKELARLKAGLVLVPGMPAEAFMQTEKRSAINYLLKPATDQLSRAFREE